MNMKNLLAACLFCGIALTLSAQQSVPPPPQPANDAPANAGVLKLLRQGLSARVVLHGIAATPGKFDTSAAALTALKQAGANEDELSAIMAKGAPSAEQPPAAAMPAAPVAAPAANSPTLADTMKFIQDKLNDNNKTSWIDYAKPTRGAGSGWIDTVTHEFSSVVADTGQCHISYHIFTKHSEPYRWLATSDGRNNNGKNNKGEDISFSLRSVQEIVVKPWEQYETEWLAKNGHPDATVISSAPATTALVVRQPHGVENVFTFDDAALADRVAKAMVHSVGLCGGGKSEEPF
jgi:hypothetical protein